MRQVRRAPTTPPCQRSWRRRSRRSRLLGIPILHPFLDADLTAFLYVTPPELLMRGGATKSDPQLHGSSIPRPRLRAPTEAERQRVLHGDTPSGRTRDLARTWRSSRSRRSASSTRLSWIEPCSVSSRAEESLESFRIWYVLSLEVGTCENWPRKRVWPSTVGVILSSQRNWRRTCACRIRLVLCGGHRYDQNERRAKQSWDTMELRYVGNVRDVVRMPGNGKSGTGADPGTSSNRVDRTDSR